MAVVVTVTKGYDLGYAWKNQGQPGAEQTAGGYYINAAQAGEPPGRWWGPASSAGGHLVAVSDGPLVGAECLGGRHGGGREGEVPFGIRRKRVGLAGPMRPAGCLARQPGFPWKCWVKAVCSAWPLGDPNPVHGSQPVPA